MMRIPLQRRWLLSLAALGALSIQGTHALAQASADNYPARPVTVIAPYGPGGPSDRESRLTTSKIGEILGQPFVQDFKPGAGTMLGSSLAAKAAPDGYTLLVVSTSFTVLPAFYKDIPYDTIKDFAPISQVTRRLNVLVAAPSFPVKDFPEFMAYVKANPGKVNFATTGVGGIGHLSGEWLHAATRTRVTFVHYKQANNLIPDLAAGRTDVTLTGLQFAQPLVKAGKLKLLAVTDLQRTDLLPGVKTIAEQGVPGYSYIGWQGFSAPAGTPPAIINKLSEAFAKVARSPEVTAMLEAEGGAPVGSTPAQFRQLIATETERWKRLVEENGIKADP